MSEIVFLLPKGTIPPCTKELPDGTLCGKLTVYIAKLLNDKAKVACCEEHGALIRTYPDLEYIHSI